MQLGLNKHDNGVLLCSPDGKVFKVADHDFPFDLSDIYPEGTTLVDASRLNEKAVLRPVGAYDLVNKTGFVSLVLGKDTAASMCNLLRIVVAARRRQMPNLKRLVLLADGGGANASNSITWKDELAKLSKELKLEIEVLHYSPGSSKSNPAEHLLWSYISIHTRGKPYYNIETVLKYMNETTTITGLEVFCWFDPEKYLTNEEKIAQGLQVTTGDELAETLNGRIVHAFGDDTDLYKWHCLILPERETEAVLEARRLELLPDSEAELLAGDIAAAKVVIEKKEAEKKIKKAAQKAARQATRDLGAAQAA